MVENILLIIAGFFLLVKGADILVDGASSIAKKFNISSLIIGLTIVAIGTSMPELIVSLKSMIVNQSNVSIGSVIGSNIFNLLVVLGVCSIISQIKFKKEMKLVEIIISLVMTFTVFIIANNNSQKMITKQEGILLLVLFVFYLLNTILIGKYGEISEHKIEEEDIGVLKSFLFIFIGIIALNFGGDFVVDNVIEIIKKFNVNERLLSLTVLSVGTSLPELVTSINAIYKKEDDIAVGNIIGSNIFNFLLIIGISAIINPIKFSVDFNIDIMFLFVSTAILLVIPYIGKKNRISKPNGIFFILLYIGYIISLFVR